MSTNRKGKRVILVADDSEVNRSILADILSGDYEILEAENGAQTIEKLREFSSRISLVLLDTAMPDMDGAEVLSVMNQRRWIDSIPVLILSSDNDTETIERALLLGATDYIARPFNASVVRRRINNTLAVYIKQNTLVDLVTDRVYDREKGDDLMISILGYLVEFRNQASRFYVMHIRKLTEMLLQRLVDKRENEVYRLTRNDVENISMASTLHDIGKISIPEGILNKPGKLTAEEFDVMKTHVSAGLTIFGSLPAYYREEPLLKRAYEIIRWHHERYDGKGYPDGLQGEDIPISAQVVGLADAYDALTSERVYKKALSHEEAMQTILSGECGAFNPVLLDCLKEIADGIVERLNESDSCSKEAQKNEICGAVMRNKGLTVSDRTIRLLEDERAKMQGFAALSREIQFEYTYESKTLTFSEIGAARMNVNVTVVDPERDRAVRENMSEETHAAICALIETTTPQNPIFSYELELNIEDEMRWHRLIGRTMWSGDGRRITGLIGKIQDVHDERMEILRLQFKALHDSLTELCNRDYAKEKIAKRLCAASENKKFALIIIDLDYFKSANDNYGHAFGDRVLKYTADILRQNVRREDVIARVGGDEFLTFMEYPTQAEPLIERIFHALSGAYGNFRLSVSMGIACSDSTERDYDVLFHRADQALYTAKKEGRNRYRFYDDSMKDSLTGEGV